MLVIIYGGKNRTNKIIADFLVMLDLALHDEPGMFS